MIRANLDHLTKKRLNSTYKDFLSYYSAIRHFGKIKNDENYRSVDELTLAKLDLFQKMTIEIWDIVITIYRRDKEIDIDEDFSSISESVNFDKLTNKPSP